MMRSILQKGKKYGILKKEDHEKGGCTVRRPFTMQEARYIVGQHENARERLRVVESLPQKLRQRIKDESDRLAAHEIMNTLRSIPVEELGREQRGVKVKTLRDNGYSNIAEIYAASVYQLEAIRGISADGAQTIKRLVKSYYEQTAKGVKIRLSADDRNRYATELVTAISAYRKSLELADQAGKLLREYEYPVQSNVVALKPVSSELRWLFSSRAIKDRAITAFQALKVLWETDYAGNVNGVSLEGSRLESLPQQEAWSDFSAHSVSFFTVLEEINPGLLGTDDDVYGLPEALAREIQDQCFFPDGLRCTLRRYQEWGVKYILHQERVLLGDEMGLGKTIQAIASMVSLKNTGATHFVVVCPASVLTNWCREIQKHSLLSVTKVHGSGRSLAVRGWLEAGGVAVTTYETTAHFHLPADFRFSMVVVDEAHYIKNPEARRTVHTKELCDHAERLLFMTGTALENRVEEMIRLIGILQPKIASQAAVLSFLAAAPQFREQVAPVYYRRKREDVLTELPELIESREWCNMGAEEERIYEDAILEGRYTDARRVSWNVDDLKYSSKANRLREIIDEAAEEQRKILVFSFFLDTIHRIHELLGDRCMNPINGSVSPQRRQEIIDEFDKAPAGAVLLAQIQSGGTGLNIQSASVVVICEPQFKPSIENQAIARAYRMGQARNVLVYRLLCEDTVDERITAMLEEKQAIFNAFADQSVAARESLELDEQSFGSLIADEIERIKAKRGDSIVDSPTAPVISESDIVTETFETYGREARKESHEPEKKTDNRHSGTPSSEYERECCLSYDQLVGHLLEKYGPVPGDYFVNENCATKNKRITRTAEGLLCHHVDEDKQIMLSNSTMARKHPFAYQKADRLVYCNQLEHLLLHVKIAEEDSKSGNSIHLRGIGGAVTCICRELNDCYNGYTFTQTWQIRVMKEVEKDFDSYIHILNHFWRVISNDPVYSKIINKKELALDSKGRLVSFVYEQIV